MDLLKMFFKIVVKKKWRIFPKISSQMALGIKFYLRTQI